MIESISVVATSASELTAALTLCMKGMSVVKYWEELEGVLHLHWYEGHAKKPSKLMAEIRDPELVSGLVLPWLKNAKYPSGEGQYIDEDDVKGFTVKYEYSGITITPTWVTISK